MSVAFLLKQTREAGIHLQADGDRLVLEAESPPEDALLQSLKLQKLQILRALTVSEAGWTAVEWLEFYDERAGIAEYDGGLPRTYAQARAFECCISEWLERTFTPTPEGKCALCGQSRSVSGCTVLPHGTQGTGHVWLHAECWATWQARRREAAIAALAHIGLPPHTEHGA